jgi:hypothetical protein
MERNARGRCGLCPVLCPLPEVLDIYYPSSRNMGILRESVVTVRGGGVLVVV